MTAPFRGFAIASHEEKMKKVMLITITILLLTLGAFAQSDIKMRVNHKFDSPDIVSILKFQNIGLEKLMFSGEVLKDKYFLISVKEYTNGKLTKEETALDSKDLGDLGKVKGNTLDFRVLSERTSDGMAKFDFQFDRFSTEKQYKVGEKFNGFVLKDFIGANPEIAIPVNKSTYILIYMMPYIRKDGSGAYCAVAQSGDNPEEFGTKYAIPTYFLISIKFQ